MDCTKKNNRRYYLHRRLKKYFTVRAKSRQVNVTEKALKELPELYKSYIDELLSMGYNIQYIII